MSDQVISMLVGTGVVIALRLLDWAFPKGWVWRKVQEWSVPPPDDNKRSRNPGPFDDDDT